MCLAACRLVRLRCQRQTSKSERYQLAPWARLRILVVRPLAVRAQLQVVMYFHGADWVLGACDTRRRLARDNAYGARTVGVFVDCHRSVKGHYPVAFEQTHEVTKYVAQNVDEFKIDPAHLAIADDGIGGNMGGVLRLLTRECDRPSIHFQPLFSGMIGGGGVECPHNEFANGPWLTGHTTKWL
jgi:acetyl esterase